MFFMTEALIKYINEVRILLNKTDDSFLFAHIESGTSNFDESSFGKSYGEFLHICDGFWLGNVVLYGVKALKSNQSLASEIQISEGDWLCIGHLESSDGYIMMQQSTENVYLFYEGYFYKGAGYDNAYCNLGSLENFLTEYVFGKMYASIACSIEDDEWYGFMKGITECK